MIPHQNTKVGFTSVVIQNKSVMAFQSLEGVNLGVWIIPWGKGN